MATVVSIGRNVGDEPMDSTQWALFRHEVARLVEMYAGPTVFTGEGVGIYEDEREPSYTVIGSTRPVDHETFEVFADALRNIARNYEQESIAVTIGLTAFIGEEEGYGD